MSLGASATSKKEKGKKGKKKPILRKGEERTHDVPMISHSPERFPGKFIHDFQPQYGVRLAHDYKNVQGCPTRGMRGFRERVVGVHPAVWWEGGEVGERGVAVWYASHGGMDGYELREAPYARFCSDLTLLTTVRSESYERSAVSVHLGRAEDGRPARDERADVYVWTASYKVAECEPAWGGRSAESQASVHDEQVGEERGEEGGEEEA